MRLRRFPLALLALLLTGALIAGCGGDDGSGNSSSSGGGGGDTQNASALLKDSFSTGKAVKSGELKFTVAAELQGDDDIKGPLKLDLSGPFQVRDKQLPLVDWDVSATGQGQTFTGKLITTASNAFVGFRGQTYEVGTALYKQLASQVAKQQSGAPTPTNFGELGLKPESWFKDPKVSDGPSIGGDSTQKISGDIDTEAMVRDLADVLKTDAVRSRLEKQGQSVPSISNSDIDKVVSAVKNPKVEVDVDGDKRLRRLDFSTDLKRPSGETSGPTGGSLSFVFEFTKVGGTPDIKEPSGAKPIQLLLQQFGGAMGGRSGGLLTN